MTTKEIVKKYLEDNGFDGLCNSDPGCGCAKDDLAPCESFDDFVECQPAHIKICTKIGECEDCEIGDEYFLMGKDEPTKPEAKHE